MWKISCLFIVLILVIENETITRDRNNKRYRVVCYLGSWANYRNGEGKFVIEDIDPFVCTHLIYGFAKLNTDNRIAVFDPYLDLKENWGLGAYERFNNLKTRNPHLTTLLAIGGWNEGSIKYSNMASDPMNRKIFIESCVQLLKEHDFDGLDLDWEYPGTRGGKPEDKYNYILLLKELNEAFKPHGFLLTAAVSAGKTTIDIAYDIPSMSKYLDFVNLMAYDFHGSWEAFTGHNAPLYSRKEESDYHKMLNVDFATTYWLNNGFPRAKLVLGMALYGRSFTLSDANNNGLGAPATGKGMEGPLTMEGGMLGYNEICKYIGSGNWTVKWETSIKSPYAYKDRQWVGYDDRNSIQIKVEYIIQRGLGGGMVWSMETDDFRGLCHGHRYPLLNVIQRNLNGQIIELDRNTLLPEIYKTIVDETSELPRSTESSEELYTNVQTEATVEHKTEPPKPTEPSKEVFTTDPEHKLICEKEGYHKHPTNCKKFYNCYILGDIFKISEYECPLGTVFDPKIGACNFPSAVEGCEVPLK